MSDDDEDEDTRRSGNSINDIDTDSTSFMGTLSSENQDPSNMAKNANDDDNQRSWNIPDDEWAWSDEESATVTSGSSRANERINGAGTRSLTSTLSEKGNTAERSRSTLDVPTKSQKDGLTGLGLTDSSQSRRAKSAGPNTGPELKITKDPSSLMPKSTNISASTSPLATPKPRQTIASHSMSSTPSSEMTGSHPLSVAQDLIITVCDSGRYIACASKRQFAILEYQSSSHVGRSPRTERASVSRGGSPRSSTGEWVLVGQGSGVETALDAITALQCLPLYVPKSDKSQVYVVVGYKSGMIRIFNESGHLVVIQQLHHTPVVSIKTRIGAGKTPGEDEDEMTIVHEGGKVVCIEGESLWVVLRLSSGTSRHSDPMSIQSSQTPTFAYKKWRLLNQDLMVDIVSCGPARRRPTLSNGFSSSSSSSMYTSQATERFVAVGSKPMMAFYASSSSTRPLFSATSLATQMAARVTSAVFGFAKSIWSNSTSRPSSPALGSGNEGGSPDMKRLSGQGVQDGTGGPFGAIYPSAMAPATEVPAVLWLSDSQRCIRHVSLAPAPPRGSCYHYPSKLAAMTDSLGRVLLVDLEECEIIRMWKGLRGARCGWIQEARLVQSSGRGRDAGGDASTIKKHLALYLVIYAPKRGTVEIYPARQGKRAALLQVGLGWKICTTFTSPIGKPAVLDRMPNPNAGAVISSGLQAHDNNAASPSSVSTAIQEQTHPGLAQCLLVGPTGEVRHVRSRPSDRSNTPSISSNVTSPVVPDSRVFPTPNAPGTDSIAARLENLSS
ncbi:Rab3 GTPase-activating protein non-catalytic subunit [Lunasporangiospora selenospora]|uniref:Rab3 GTPase-activating protein non-catalytic subunit n=1 Tax=Lunasporangiospora selenospora TaxID=979761 RepID=A0A9P6FN79_9FUNG|nr:Rab3 GTPase-activating protein non-catalytic subunit [Lunasporangiospora selenospora]